MAGDDVLKNSLNKFKEQVATALEEVEIVSIDLLTDEIRLAIYRQHPALHDAAAVATIHCEIDGVRVDHIAGCGRSPRVWIVLKFNSLSPTLSHTF